MLQILPDVMPAEMQAAAINAVTRSELIMALETNQWVARPDIPELALAKDFFMNQIAKIGAKIVGASLVTHLRYDNGDTINSDLHRDILKVDTRKCVMTLSGVPNASTLYYDDNLVAAQADLTAHALFVRNPQTLELCRTNVLRPQPATTDWTQAKNGQVSIFDRAKLHSAAPMPPGTSKLFFSTYINYNLNDHPWVVI